MGHTIEAHSGRRPLEIFRAQAALFEREQRAFITGFGSGLNLSEFDGILLHRLVVASPAHPVSTSRLSAYMLAEFYGGRVGIKSARKQTLAGISYLNSAKLPDAEVRIHNMSAPRQEEQYFIGGVDNWLFPEQAATMNLVAAGFSLDEIVDKGVYRSVSTLKDKLTDIYSWLGIRNELGASLFLAQHGQVDLDMVTQRVNIERFNSLQPGQIEILESLISEGGRTNLEIASELKITVPVAKRRFGEIYNALRVNGIVNRVGVGIAYWIFKGQPKVELPALEPGKPAVRLTDGEIEVMHLRALGLGTKTISSKLFLSENTIKNKLSLVYNKLGVKTELEAVLKLIEDGVLDINELTKGVDLDVLESLTGGEISVMDALIQDRETGATNRSLAQDLRLAGSTIKNRLSNIGDKVLVEHDSSTIRTRLAVLYLAYLNRDS